MKTFQDGDPLFGVMVDAIARLWPTGTAVLTGCTQTGSGATRTVTIAAGTVAINGTRYTVSGQNKTLDAAAFDRYDLISVNTSGTVIVTKGTEERRVPALPANQVPICICLIETGQTTLPADRIFDARLLSSHVPTGVLSVGTATDPALYTDTDGRIYMRTTVTNLAASNTPIIERSFVAMDQKTTAFVRVSIGKNTSGTVRLYYTGYSSQSDRNKGYRFRKNNIVIAEHSVTDSGTVTHQQDIKVNPGDVVDVVGFGSGASYAGGTDFTVRIGATQTTAIEIQTINRPDDIVTTEGTTP